MYTNKATFYRLIRYSKKYLGILITLILLMLFLVFAELANGWFFKEFIDNLVKHDMDMVIIVFLIGLGVNIFMSFALYLRELFTDKFGEKIGNDLREDLFAHIIHLPMSSLDKYHSGGLISLLLNDINLAKLAIGYNLLHLISSPLLAFSVLIYMFVINWKLAILCASISPLMFLSGKIYGIKIRQNTSRLQNSFDKYTTFAQESLQGITEIKCDSVENKITNKFSCICNSILENAIINCILASKLFFVTNFVGFLTYAILWGVGGWLTLQGEISVGDLLFFTRLLDRLINPFTQLANRWAQFQKSIASSKRIFEVMEEKTEGDDEKSYGICISSKKDYTIKLNKINFSYDKKIK